MLVMQKTMFSAGISQTDDLQPHSHFQHQISQENLSTAHTRKTIF